MRPRASRRSACASRGVRPGSGRPAWTTQPCAERGHTARDPCARSARLPAGDDALGLVQVPPVPGGSEARPSSIGRLGTGFSRPIPIQAGLGLGWTRSAAVGGLTGHPLQAHPKFSKSKPKHKKTVVCRTRLAALLTDGPGAVRGSVGAPWGCIGGRRGGPGGTQGLPLPPRRRPPLPPLPGGCPASQTATLGLAWPARWPRSLRSWRFSFRFFLTFRTVAVSLFLCPRFWRVASDSGPCFLEFDTGTPNPSEFLTVLTPLASRFPDPRSCVPIPDLCLWEET